jgi:cardiolipin synthase
VKIDVVGGDGSCPHRLAASTRRLAPRAAGVAGVAALGVYAGQAAKFRRQARRILELPEPAAPGSPAFCRWMEGACTAPLREGNRVSVLRNGNEIAGSMIDAIAGAESSVDLSNYILWSGAMAQDFVDVLAERARAGVEVNVLLDAWGSAKRNAELAHELERAGVALAWFRPPRWHQLDQFNNRMHRRVLVVDGTVGFTGGFGMGDEWIGDAEGPGHWRDTHLRLEGPVVRDLAGAFHDNWSESSGRLLGSSHFPELPPIAGGAGVQLSRSSPGHGPAATELLFLAAVLGARERLWVATAYFAPRRGVVEALVAAARRGVDVRLVVNGQEIDKPPVRRAGQRDYARLLEAGARIFEYQRTMMHSKVLVVDDAWATVGSANWDNRSMALQEEINCSVMDPGVVAELEKDFLEDFDDSEEIDLDRWRQRSPAARAYEAVSALFRHSL